MNTYPRIFIPAYKSTQIKYWHVNNDHEVYVHWLDGETTLSNYRNEWNIEKDKRAKEIEPAEAALMF